MKKQLL
ncbi:hypothetical protein SOVF_031930, partial [Spinacia oleracea]